MPLERITLTHVGGRRYRVAKPFVVYTHTDRVIAVPAGFLTDGGSVPFFLWPLYPPFGSDCDEGYVVHDYLYAHAEEFSMDRAEADAVMREIHKAYGFRPSGLAVVYGGVRLGGWLAWRRHRARRASEAAAGRSCPCCVTDRSTEVA